MDELEMLRKQKSEIDARIRELEHFEITEGGFRIGIGRNAYSGDWTLTYKYFNSGDEWRKGRNTYTTMAVSDTRKELIEQIPDLISDLQKLYNKAKGE